MKTLPLESNTQKMIRQRAKSAQAELFASQPQVMLKQQNNNNNIMRWQETLEKSIGAVVSLNLTLARAFDTDKQPGHYYATGFVVDKKSGLILTNRHVVGTGPVFGTAVFADYEQVQVWPVYRDPLHDFGFMRYDPLKLRYNVVEREISLNPQGARIGTEVRVVGNDAGEKLSILQGTLARLDRPAPAYGQSRYSDMNTFYIQAASGTSGGSSGSPVLNIEGEAVGLNAGANSASSQSYYLPVDRVKRALELIRHGLPVPRGCLQVHWQHKSFNEAFGGMKGACETIEQQLRSENHFGVLVATKIVPGSQSEGLIREGDVLLSVGNTNNNTNDHLIGGSFEALEDFCDRNVGRSVNCWLLRRGEIVSVLVHVCDLHRQLPDELMEIGDSVIHPLSIQLALQSSACRVGMPFIANAGCMLGIEAAAAEEHSSGCVVTAVNDESVGTFREFVAKISHLIGNGDDKKIVRLKYFHLQDFAKRRQKTAVAYISEMLKYFPFRLAKRCDSSGQWLYRNAIASSNSTLSSNALPSSLPSNAIPNSTSLHKTLNNHSDAVQISLASLVIVNCTVPYPIEGYCSRQQSSGVGFVLCGRRGLVVCDRHAVPVSVGAVKLTFNLSNTECPANILFQHPQFNFCILQYNPSATGLGFDLPAMRLSGANSGIAKGGVILVSVDQNDWSGDCVKLMRARIEQSVELPFQATVPPRFRPFNLEFLTLQASTALLTNRQYIGGLLLSADDARLMALWTNVSDYCLDPCEPITKHLQGIQFAGLPVEFMRPTIEALLLNDDNCDSLFFGACEFRPISHAAAARKFGFPSNQVMLNDGRKTLLQVSQVFTAIDPNPSLQPGDLLMSVTNSNSAIKRCRDLLNIPKHSVMTIWREGREVKVKVTAQNAFDYSSSNSNQLLLIGWGGAVFQKPYYAVLEQTHLNDNSHHLPYITCVLRGSPAEVCGLTSGHFVTAVVGTAVGNCTVGNLKDLERALKASTGRIQLDLVHRSGAQKSVSVVPSDFWPLWAFDDGEVKLENQKINIT